MHMTFRKTVLAATLALAFGSANAALERVGPNSPSHGFPQWYQDTTGLALEFCSVDSQAILDGGWCLLLPGDVPGMSPNGTATAEQFPSVFADEHFYWAGDAQIDIPATGGRARLVLGMEAAFATGGVVPGAQITFGRIRFDIRDLPAGDYTITHPYGVDIFPGHPGGRLFFTEDIGFNCAAGQFDCALQTRIGPFLLPSATAPGGPEQAAVTGPDGKLYISDGAAGTFVTGSPLGTNFFRIERTGGAPMPGGLDLLGGNVLQIDTFTLMGRVLAGTLPGKVTVERAGYTKTAAGAQKLDVFAKGEPTVLARIPAQPAQAPTAPALSFFDAPCGTDAAGNPAAPVAGSAETFMSSAATSYWGQAQPAAIPGSVCVRDSNARDAQGQPTGNAYYPATVTDEVSITQALYDPANGGSLTVVAASSDEVVPPTLTVVVPGAAAPVQILGSGQVSVSPLAAPPAKVLVQSQHGGLNQLNVTTGFAGTTGGGTGNAVATNDAFTVSEDSSANVLDVLANDTTGGAANPATLTLLALPQLGTATVVSGQISYTPNPNAFGTDTFTYTVTGTNGVTSNVGSVTVTVTNVNDAPVAVNDGATTVGTNPVTINVLANDTDADGKADLTTAQIVTPPASGSAVVNADGTITFTPAGAGQFTFTYNAVDAAGATSATPATVTVDVATAEQVNITTALFRTSQQRWVVNGSSSVAGGEIITVRLTSGNPASPCSAEGRVIGTDQVDAAGAFLVDVRPGFDPRTTNCSRVQAESSLGGKSPAVSYTVRR